MKWSEHKHYNSSETALKYLLNTQNADGQIQIPINLQERKAFLMGTFYLSVFPVSVEFSYLGILTKIVIMSHINVKPSIMLFVNIFILEQKMQDMQIFPLL